MLSSISHADYYPKLLKSFLGIDIENILIVSKLSKNYLTVNILIS